MVRYKNADKKGVKVENGVTNVQYVVSKSFIGVSGGKQCVA